MGDFAGMHKKFGGLKGFLWFLFWTFIAFLPLELWLLIRWLATPQGFWQNLILGVVGLWFLGGIQLILFIAWVVVLLFFVLD